MAQTRSIAQDIDSSDIDSSDKTTWLLLSRRLLRRLRLWLRLPGLVVLQYLHDERGAGTVGHQVVRDMHDKSACSPVTEIYESPFSNYNLGFEGKYF